MSDFKPEFPAVRTVPPNKIRRTLSHTPLSANNRTSPFYYNPNHFTNKNRPKDGLLPSPQLDFHRMYSTSGLRLSGPANPAELERSRSPSPANAIRFTPLHHTHDISLSIKREATAASSCAATSATTANSVPSKLQTPLLLAPSPMSYPLFCIPPIPHHLTIQTPSAPSSTGHQHATMIDASGAVSYADNSIKRLSKSLIPYFQDGTHSPEPPMHRSPSSSSDEFKSSSLRGYKSSDQSSHDSDYESGSSNSASALHSPVDVGRDLGAFSLSGPSSNLSESDRSSSCCSPSLSSDSDSALNAPTRSHDTNRPLSYRTDTQTFSSSSSSSSSSPEPQYPLEDVLFIDNKKLPKAPHLSSPATTPCSSHVCLPGVPPQSMALSRSPKETPATSTATEIHSYYVEPYRTAYTPHHPNNTHKNHGHGQGRRRTLVRGETHSRAYTSHPSYAHYRPGEVSKEIYNSQMVRHQTPYDRQLSMQMKINSLECSQSEEMFLAKQNYCQKLTACVQEIFEGVQFSIVGSSMNGFSTSDCDLDLCMMTPNHPTPTRKEAMDKLWEVSFLLKKRSIGELHQVINAKTPIIKFTDPDCGFEVDISINNHHGVRNTNMLRKYSKMDERVRPLIVTIKQWAKHQQVCNARLGTLSSYSITLMVIFYLQNGCDAPVLPSLEELHQHYYEFWDMFTDLDNNEVIWKSTNQQSLAELLHGFFKFYTEFNYQNTMSVRTASVLPPSYDLSFQCIRIEEPYTRENVAHSVSKPWCFTSIKTHIQNAYYLLHHSEVPSIEALYSNRPVATIPSFAQNYYL